MSHQPERKEKDCLNCGTIIAGRFCQVCGQENIVPHQPVGSLILHFIYDIFHFDGKFFETLKYLLFRPGYVPAQFIAGKRISYLDPIRMYLFTSAIFFLIFFAIKSPPVDERSQMSRLHRYDEGARTMMAIQQRPNDSALHYKMKLLLDTTLSLKLFRPEPGKPLSDSVKVQVEGKVYGIRPEIDSSVIRYKDKNQNWFVKRLRTKLYERSRKLGDDDTLVLTSVGSEFMHRFPYILFFSLPLFALILKMLYARKGRFYYSDHAIFTLYQYIFTFILMMFLFGVDALEKSTGWRLFSWLQVLLSIAWAVHLWAGMKYFYRQGWLKTSLKFILLNLLAFIMLSVLLLVFMILLFIF